MTDEITITIESADGAAMLIEAQPGELYVAGSDDVELLIAPTVTPVASGNSVPWGQVTGSLASQADLVAELAGKASVSHGHDAAAISDFAEAVMDRVAAFLVAGSNVTLTHDDVADTLTIAATGGGGSLADGDYGDIVVSGGGVTMTIDTLNHGITGSLAGGAAIVNQVFGEGTTGNTARRHSNNTSAPEHQLDKARGTIAVPAVVLQNDRLGEYRWRGHSGSTFVTAAFLRVIAKAATPGPADMEARLELHMCGPASVSASQVLGIDHATGLGLYGSVVIDENRLLRLRSYADAGLPAAATPRWAWRNDGIVGPVYDTGSAWASPLDRAQHQGTQTAATISDFDAEVAARLVAEGAVIGPASAADTAIPRFDGTTGTLIQDSGVLISDGNEIDLPLQAAPTAPAADRIKIFAGKHADRMMPRFIGPAGIDMTLQVHFGFNATGVWQANGNATTVTAIGMIGPTATGTATAANVATTKLHTRMRRLEYLVTAAATTAVAGFRHTAAMWTVGGAAAEHGGFFFVCRWGPATGVATTTNRAFVGMGNATGAPTDAEPSSITNIVGMGWDAADTNIQFMHRGAGAVTKIDLGASFPVPTVDRNTVYELTMFSPPGTTQELHYEVRELGTANVASGTITTNLPTTATFLAPRGWMSVGGTSSVIGIALMSLYLETDY